MSILTQTEMFPIVLKYMADGETRTNKQIKSEIVDSLRLSDDELAMKTSTGAPTCSNRVGWAIQHLQRAKLLNRVDRGVYQISEEGRELSSTDLNPNEFASHVRSLISERDPWNAGSKEEQESSSAPDEDISPEESIDAAIRSLNASLAEELLNLIMSMSPEFFENLVVDLLVKMGYGTGKVTQRSNDKGIDGIITTDALGFDPIYTQAKRYNPDNKVGRPEIQAFAGALGHFTRGIFITTSSFANNAVEYAKSYPHATIVLIDGMRLANLMIAYDLGVSTEHEYKVKRIDIDYFEQE